MNKKGKGGGREGRRESRYAVLNLSSLLSHLAWIVVGVCPCLHWELCAPAASRGREAGLSGMKRDSQTWVLADLSEPQFPWLYMGKIAARLPECLPRMPFRWKEKTQACECFIKCENKTTLTYKSLLPTRVDYYF